jgi:transcriptional regulator with XRE-family HTH domain
MIRSAKVAPQARLSTREVLRVNIIVGRAKSRLSQEQLAERAGVSRPTISRIERAQADVGIDVVEHIAVALGVNVAELFTPWSNEEPDESELIARGNDEDFIDAGDLLNAVDEANGAPLERYSNAGRPRVAR